MTKIITLLLLLPCSLFATTFSVSNANDAGAGSLRQAIISANADAGAPHTINITGSGTITLQSDLPALSKSTTINGAAIGSTISGNNLYRIFQAIGTTTTLISIQLRRLTLQNAYLNVVGSDPAGGAALYGNYIGAALIEDCHFKNDTTRLTSLNSYAELKGGACYLNATGSIPNGSTAVIRRCTFSGNAAIISASQNAVADGGALYIISLTDTIENCTFTNNYVRGQSTVAGGSVRASGAGVAFYGSSVRFINCTIVNNTCVGQQAAGGSIDSLGAGVRMLKYSYATYFKNCIIDKNSGGSTPNIYPAGFVSEGHNVIGIIGAVPAANFMVTDTINTNSKVNLLGNNGGLTPTCSIPSNSVAVNKVPAGSAPATDQRGYARVGNPDAGAYEYNATIFPLHLLSFTASQNEMDVQLKWTTANEINVAHFVIERSINGRDFYVIGERAANGNSTLDKSYFFTDSKPLKGANFYRLKMVDLDGKFTYSATVAVTIRMSAVLTIYKNPVKENLVFSIAGDITLAKIYNIEGNLLLVRKVSSGSNSLMVQSLTAGTYLLQVYNNSELIARASFIKL